MEAEHTVTAYDFWKNTIHTVESAYCWLKLYEDQNYELIDRSIASLRDLITHGKDYEAMKSYKTSSSSSTTTTTSPPSAITVKEASTNNWRKQQYNPPLVSYELESNWEKVNENTVKVHYGNGTAALCIAITKEEELDQVIQDIYSAKSIAVDCEFLGLKNALPELKLLQIGVSKDKGYAIQVDLIGPEAITSKFKPVLEDEKLDIVGWSFRGDALAIESYIKQIDLSPILDLQAKLRPIAVETLNLGAAMSKYASDWYGHQEFQRAKLYGNQFFFTGEHCIWLSSPLPPKALVYACFDVLSLIALHESTSQYPNNEKEFWPFTVLSDSSPKAVERWHRQRAKGINTASSLGGGNDSSAGMVSIIKPAFSTNKKNGKGRASSSSSSSTFGDNVPDYVLPTTVSTKDDGYNDDDIRYKRELQLAIERSVKETMQQQRNGESSSSNGDRIVSEEQMDLSDIAAELNENPYNKIYHFSARGDDNDYDNQDFKQEEETKEQGETEFEATWGLEVLDEQPFIGKKFATSTFSTATSGDAYWPVTEEEDETKTEEPTPVPTYNTGDVSWATEQKSKQAPPTPASPAISNASTAARTITSLTNQSPVLTKSPLKKHQKPGPIPVSSPFLEKPLYKPPPQTSSPSPSNNVKNTASTPKSQHAEGATTRTASGWNNSASPNLSQWGDRLNKPPTNQKWGNQSATQQQWANDTSSQRGSSNNQQQQQQKQEWGKNDTANSSWNNASNISSPASSDTNNQWDNNSANTTPINQNAYTNSPTRQFARPPNTASRPRPSSGIYQQQQQQQQAPPFTSTLSASSPAWNPSNNSSPQQQPQQPKQVQQQQSFKPDKGKYTNEFKNRITMNGQQSGSFTWSKPEKGQMSTATWNSFAINSVNDWKKGKDTDLNAISNADALAAAATAAATATAAAAAAAAVTTTTTTTTNVETVKFNTSISKYTQGGQIGDSNTGQMHNNQQEDNWTRQEERPDTMVMPMNQIPIRTVFTGPRIINPNDADFVSNDDDEDQDDDSDDYNSQDDDVNFPRLTSSSTALPTQQQEQTSTIERLPNFIDGIYLYSDDGNGELAMLKLSKPEHLDMIEIPSEEYTVTICYHFINRNKGIELKALQLYLSTGASYTAIIEQSCLLKDRQHIKSSKFGRLLTDPVIKRICWCPDYIESEMKVKLGFAMGPCIDLSQFANHGRDDNQVFSFSGATDYYLRDWKDLDQFKEAKRDFDQANAKKFSATFWDREKLPYGVLVYCAMQGLAAHQVYVESKNLLDPPEQDFIYHSA